MTIQPWVVMWTLAFAIFCVCKWFTWSRVAQPTRIPGVSYLLLWPGLDAEAFLHKTAGWGDFPTKNEWHFALTKFLVGLTVLYGVTRFAPGPYWIGWVGMVGIVMFSTPSSLWSFASLTSFENLTSAM
jgi:hypothetical protein